MPHEIVCTMAANNMIKGILESLFSHRNTHLLFTPLSTLQRGLFLFLWVINVNLHVDFLLFPGIAIKTILNHDRGATITTTRCCSPALAGNSPVLG